MTEDIQNKFRIIQCARMIGSGHGVSSPTLSLERAFKKLGYQCDRFTLQDIGIKKATPDAGSHWTTILLFWRDVIAFSFFGTILLWWRYRWRQKDNVIILCHVDALIGDLFVIRSLHKSYVMQNPKRWRLFIRNPLHFFVLARDAIRFRGRVHKRIIALSKSAVEEVTRLYGIEPDNIRVIPNGIDIERFRPSTRARHEIRSELGWNNEKTTVLIFVANNFKGKGLDIVLGALIQLLKNGLDCRLIVAGSDSVEPFSTKLSKLGDAVHLAGHRQDIERYYTAADLFVLPTAYDISPLVGREALACGLPILMSRVGGIPYFLREGENGLFVDRNPVDVAEKIRRLIEDVDKRKRMANQARVSVKFFDWSIIARNYLKVMEEIMEERREGKRKAGTRQLLQIFRQLII